jgi:hypothetical protein
MKARINATTIDSIVSRIADGRLVSGGCAAVRGEVRPLPRGSLGFAGSGGGPLLFVVEAMKRTATPFALAQW